MNNRAHSTVQRVLIAGALAALSSFAQQYGWAQDDNPPAKYIKDMEKEWTESTCTHLSAAKFIADDFQGTAPNGERYDKAKALQLHSSLSASECRLDEATVHFFGDNTAIVSGKERATIKVQGGSQRTRCLVWTHTWLNRRSKWQMVSAQDTALPCQ